MLVDGSGSGVDLTKYMQLGRDLENEWLMFDHVKHVQAWTTMEYHVYDAMYYKVMTITIYDMHLEDMKVQCIMWKIFNKLIRDSGVEKPNFKDFMADNE